MKIGIIPDRAANESYSEKWCEYIKQHGHESEILHLDANNLDKFNSLDGIMWRFKHTPREKRTYHILSNYFEKILKIPIYPDSSTAWHFDEKIAQHFLFAGSSFPHVKGFLFFTYEDAMAWLSVNEEYPLVHKLSTGAGSANVSLIYSAKEARQMAHRMFNNGLYPYSYNEFKKQNRILTRFKDTFNYFRKGVPRLDPNYYNIEKNYLYFQRFLSGNPFDTRITVIGNRAFGYRRFNRENDFRASGSGKIDYDFTKIDLRCVEIAFKVSESYNFKSMAYDFLYNAEGDPEICEISYTFVAKFVHNCPGHWNQALEWIDQKMRPEEAQVEDFIKILQSGEKR